MADEAPTSCANCGKAENDDAPLKTCNACKLVKYCGRECQIAHRSSHRKACKKRAAELYEEALFKQPPKEDDCPICFQLLPNRALGKTFMSCCGKTICHGCRHTHELQSSGHPSCPFCRLRVASSTKECIAMMEKRVDANDAEAILQLGKIYLNGDEDSGIREDADKAVNLFHRAAELGSAEAYHSLSAMYVRGLGVKKDDTKAIQYCEKAAMAGNVNARFNLGNMDADAGNFDQAVKHWLIAASCGHIKAVNEIKKAMCDGNATRDHYAQALRGYQQWVNEVVSDERDRAAAYSDEYKYLFGA
jgi:tetratricopeptide (TPR) repeat protein